MYIRSFSASESSVEYHPIFFTTDFAFEEFYCICIQLVSKTWREMKATASGDFNRVTSLFFTMQFILITCPFPRRFAPQISNMPLRFARQSQNMYRRFAPQISNMPLRFVLQISNIFTKVHSFRVGPFVVVCCSSLFVIF